MGETFTNWAWNIAYPGICDSPAQCASALLGVVDEYNESYSGAVIAAYIAAYNSGDIDRVMSMFSEASVVTGHPFADSSTGLAAIRSIQLADLASAGPDAYTISNVEVTGDTVTWDHVWTNSNGTDYCQFGQNAVVESGSILSWTWPTDGGEC